tara:strand:- start:2098 stop:4233 length:2136 start_codon:yes stop_codon:yes gene_type:complete
MANTIKLKRGSGSDPGSSDLVVGEIAVRTDSGKLFTKKDDNSIAEISGGGINDGDKGDITVSSSGATWTIDSGATQVANKLPLAGGTLTGNLLFGDSVEARFGAGNDLKVYHASNISTILDSYGDLRIMGDTIRLQRQAGGENFFYATEGGKTSLYFDGSEKVQTSNTGATISGTCTATAFSGPLTGNVTGNTSGSAGSCTGNAATATTLATARTIGGTSFNGSADIDISYANLTNKLSVGDGGLTQNNFTNALKSKLDGIAASATNVTNNNQLTNGAGYITATLTTEQVQDIVGGMFSGNTETNISATYQDSDGTIDLSSTNTTYSVGDGGLTQNNFTNTLKSKLDGIESSATADQTASEILTLIKTVDGSGSGLDADTVDGLNPATSDGANRIVRTDSSGYMYGNYINMNGTFATSANGSGMGRFTGTNGSDTFGRSYTAAAARTLLNVADGATNVTNNNQLTNGAGYITSSGTSAACSGNAATATTLATARTIAGVSFNGSANISLNNNAITNGAGYTTFTANQALNTNSGVSFTSGSFSSTVSTSTWYYNQDANEGLYNNANGQHWYSSSSQYWNMDNNGSSGGIIFRDNHQSTIRGYVYYNNSNQIGFLDSGGSWRLYVNTSSNVVSNNHFIPQSNNSYDLGTSSYRWRNLYVNDLQLSNEVRKDEGGNEVDGTWGDWTLQEGEENIFMINNRSKKRYKMSLVEVP